MGIYFVPVAELDAEDTRWIKPSRSTVQRERGTDLYREIWKPSKFTIANFRLPDKLLLPTCLTSFMCSSHVCPHHLSVDASLLPLMWQFLKTIFKRLLTFFAVKKMVASPKGSVSFSGCHHHRDTTLPHASHLSGTSLDMCAWQWKSCHGMLMRAQVYPQHARWAGGHDSYQHNSLSSPLGPRKLFRAATHQLSYNQSSSVLCWTTFNGTR